MGQQNSKLLDETETDENYSKQLDERKKASSKQRVWSTTRSFTTDDADVSLSLTPDDAYGVVNDHKYQVHNNDHESNKKDNANNEKTDQEAAEELICLPRNYIQVFTNFDCGLLDGNYFGHLVDKPAFAEGKFRSVYHALYCTGAQRNARKQLHQRAVVKKWKEDCVVYESFWNRDLRVCQIA